MGFEIEWVNHASYILRHKDFELLTDPWLYGPVFDNGWDLISPTQQPREYLRKIRNIWISHEHPDHFNPNFFKSYSAEEKSLTKIYFQESKDRRVASFLKGIGFQVVEMPNREWLKIEPEIAMSCTKNGSEDSYLEMIVGKHVIVNLNDCIFPDDRELLKIKRRHAKIDLLLSQFGYAEKVGNYPDLDLRKKEAKKWRQGLIHQTQLLRAEHVIPFASFKYFSHQENFYMNEGASSIAEMDSDLDFAGLKNSKVILYPGDKWTYSNTHNSSLSIQRYASDLSGLKVQHFTKDLVSFEELQTLAEKHVNVLKQSVSKPVLKLLRKWPFRYGLQPIQLFISDLGINAKLDINGGLSPTHLKSEFCDIEITSSALKYLFIRTYGGNSLFVNGRFQTKTKKGIYTLFSWAHLGLIAGTGERLNGRYFVENLNRILKFFYGRLSV